MDFYNFEKYNDIFCFKKLNNDYQPLLKTYKDNYKTSLHSFLIEYEENTEIRFIESQLYICNVEIKTQKSIINSLEKHCKETFYYIKNRINERHFVYAKTQKDPFENETSTIKNEPEDQKINDFEELKAPTVIEFTNDDDDDDDDVLDTYATSENFIKFISNRITSLYLINDFLEQRKKEVEAEPQTKAVPENEQNNTIDNVEFSFVNEFDSIDEIVVFNYFKKELVDKKYLSLENLEIYLKLSFEKKELPKTKFILQKSKTLKVIRVIFYNYFKNIAYKPNGKQSEYIKLLTDYFQGFEFEKVKNNFNK
jgi:hypothetical protein